ncbi:low specificity L-threonine aldolase [Candidatus Woesearchaeota archaeon]|nr:low specificity L-threonine aldolase [Candidatus Woesearchaeota archaeon]
MTKISKGFASDNYSGTHPRILEAIQKANLGHASAYGNDEYTAGAVKKFKEHFGKDVDVYFVYNGTGANVLALKAVTESFNSIACAETAHLNVDECGAPEKFTGCKLLTVPTKDGKISVEELKRHVYGFGDQHHAQPKVISITQPTELGTLYTLKEVKELADYAHKNNMLLHVDGARLSNAAASLDKSLKEITFDLGVDVISFGGTKNGMMFGEAVVFRNKELSGDFAFIRKQGMQLASKMRFISAQFEEILSNDLWLKNAQHSNEMAKMLAEEVRKIPKIKITQKAEANGVFAIVPKQYVPNLQKEYFFYVWNEQTSEVRWMCSFDTTEEDIHNFVALLKKIVK